MSFPPQFGNTCYCNSVLQALYFCRPFREKVLAYKSQPRKKESLLTCLADLFHSIATQKKKVGVIPPKKFITRLRKENGNGLRAALLAGRGAGRGCGSLPVSEEVPLRGGLSAVPRSGSVCQQARKPGIAFGLRGFSSREKFGLGPNYCTFVAFISLSCVLPHVILTVTGSGEHVTAPFWHEKNRC